MTPSLFLPTSKISNVHCQLSDLIDFTMMRANFGAGVVTAPPLGDPTAATPEPASAILLLLGLGAVIRRRKK